MKTLTLAQARNIAVRAQGLDRSAAERSRGTTDPRALLGMVRRLKVLQIDSVNTLVRSHYLPLFSRLGPYPRAELDRLASSPDHPPLVEYWAHEASLLPAELLPLFAWRMEEAGQGAWGSVRRALAEDRGYLEQVLQAVALLGPVDARTVEAHLEARPPARGAEQWGWNWSRTKTALEALFWSGQVGTRGRGPGFQRLYEPIDSLVASWGERERLSVEDSALRLVEHAAEALGLGTVACLADYFRLPVRSAARAVELLERSGVLVPVVVPGWTTRRAVYAHRDALSLPAHDGTGPESRALLSPFDSFIFNRPRLEGLFAFRYRLEFYVPKERRVHGYYVMPFLLGDRLVGRVDVAADRAAGRLMVHAVHWEPDTPAGAAEALDDELALLASWLELRF